MTGDEPSRHRPWAAYAGALLSIAAFVPIAGSNPLDTGFTLNRVYELGLLVMAGGLLVMGQAVNRRLLRQTLNSPSVVLIGAFVLWAAGSALWSPSRVLTFGKAGELMLLVVNAALVIAGLRSHWAQRGVNLAGMIQWLMLLILIGLTLRGLSMGMSSFTGSFNDDPNTRARFTLARIHPLLAADLMAFTAIALVASGGGTMALIGKVLMLPLLLGGLWLTDARAAIAGTGVAMMAVVWLRMRERVLGGLLLGAAAAVVLFVALAVPEVLPQWLVDAVLREDVATLNGRTPLWEFVIEQMAREPLAGYGYYASRFVLLEEFPWAGQAHNTFLEIGLSTGAVGLALLAWFIVLMLWRAAMTRSPLLLGIALYCLVGGMSNPLMFVPGIPMFLLSLCLIEADLSVRPVRQGMAGPDAIGETFAHSARAQLLPAAGRRGSGLR